MSKVYKGKGLLAQYNDFEDFLKEITTKPKDNTLYVDLSDRNVEQVGEFDWDVDGYILKDYVNIDGALRHIK